MPNGLVCRPVRRSRPLLNGALGVSDGWFDEAFEEQLQRSAAALGADISQTHEHLPPKVQQALFYVKERGDRIEGIIDFLSHYYGTDPTLGQIDKRSSSRVEALVFELIYCGPCIEDFF